MATLKDLNEKVYNIIGACMEVHKTLGPGYPVDFYRKALNIELEQKKMKTESGKSIPVIFKDVELGKVDVDFIVNENIVLSVRSQDMIKDVEVQQILHVMQLTSSAIGILVNFGGAKIQYKRILPATQQRDARKDKARYSGYREIGKTREGNPIV